MTKKKLQKSIDSVKGDVRELVEAFWALRDEVMTQQAVGAAERQSNGKKKRAAARSSDLPDASAEHAMGYVESSGYYEARNEDGQAQAHRWAMAQHPVEAILDQPLDDAAKLLAAIGHRQRLAIMLMLLRTPATASEMVANLSLGTSGAAYHHLNVLQGTGLVQQEQRGMFSIVPERIPSLLTILGGLSGVMEASVEPVSAGEEVPDSGSASE